MELYFEIVGYVASVLVLISLMMSSVLKLRLINLAGALFFVIYGVLIRAYPIMVVNFAIILVNLYYLYRMFTNKEYFMLLHVDSNSTYLHHFLDFYHEDIKKLEPDYRFSPSENQLIIFVLRNMIPAGLFIGERTADGVFNIYLDYVIPEYRDSKIGKHLFHHSRYFQQHGIHKLVSSPHSEPHEKYLKYMGFQRTLTQGAKPIYYLELQTY